MMLKKIKKARLKFLSAFLSIMIIMGACVAPVIVPAQAASYFQNKTYTFDAESGTQYGNVYVKDSNGTDRQISRGFFSESEESLRINNNLAATTSGPSGYLFNDADGLFELKEATSYSVSLRIKVVSSQVSFVKDDVTYPLSSQITELKLAYGMPSTYESNKITMDTEIGMVAKVGTGSSTFTAAQDGTDKEYNVGEWYTLTYEFTTPASFGSNGNVLGFGLKSFNGVDILVDDISVSMLHTITVDPGVGKISQTSFPHKIGDKIKIENPTYKFGYAFEGWFTDAACTKEFTDEYVTEENCEIHLYAGWSETHFSFEGYVPCHEKFGFGNFFYSIIEDEDACDGNQLLEYHYTSEYYNQIHSGSVEEGNVVYKSSRRTQRDNNISLKHVKPNTSYVVTFKYKVPAGSGDSKIYMATGNHNIWVNTVYVEYNDSAMTLTDKNPDEWCEGRMAFTTGDLETIEGAIANVAFIRLYAVNHVDTVAYLDDVRIEEVDGDTQIKLNANGGTFTNGKTVKTQKVSVGDSINILESPVREDYDFGGWYFDSELKQPVTTDKIDGSVYLNTLYAGWTRNMGFEGYYYDLEAGNRSDYLSDNVTITKENVHKGVYAAKLVNSVSNKQHVIALNPISNNTRYLVTFHYQLANTDSNINVKFATMNYSINNESEVKVYDEAYTITSDDAGKGYLMGAVIIETDCAASNANRLAMLVSSSANATYTVYFDTISIQVIDAYEGYAVLIDETTGNHKAVVGKLGSAVETYEPESVKNKFMGWYTDDSLTTLYEGGYTYSNTYTCLYAGWVEGEGFEDFSSVVSGITVTTDPDDKDNKYLTFTSSVTIKIATVESGKRYGVELRYSLEEATGSVSVAVGGKQISVPATEVGVGWNSLVYDVTADSTALYLNVAPTAAATLNIDDVIVYEINNYMSVITFDQKDGYGEDAIRIGVKGTKINFPHVPVNGNNIFYGWYVDSALTAAYGSKVYGNSDITLYARWATNPVTNVSFDDLDIDNLPFNETNSNTAALTNSFKQAGSYSMCFDRMSEETYDTYVPLANSNGLIRLESNTTYAVSFWYYFPAYSSGSTMKFDFYCSSADNYSSNKRVGVGYTVPYSTWWRVGYTYITTGELGDTDNVLYIAITDKNKKNKLYLDTIKLTRIDEGRNHIFAYDNNNLKLYEIDGNCGEDIEYPAITSNYYEVEGWYTDFELLNLHSSGKHKEEKITNLYCRWDLSDIDFENYQFEGSSSKYTVGDDISISLEEKFDTYRSLKYSYSPAIKYFETSNNVACLGRVNDDSTYRISFRYKMTRSQGDVDIKFLTAHINNRWAFITDYDKATYTIHSGEIGDSWKQATVYLTTDFATLGTSGLFMTFNPVIEGETVVYIDDVDIDYLRSEVAVVSFLDKDNKSGSYVETTAGKTVNVPEIAPGSNFASLDGWYSDDAKTVACTSVTASSGITYVYSGWNEKSEDFSNYTYGSNDENNYAQSNVISNGVLTYTANGENGSHGLRLGKIDNNTSYKVTFNYKTSANAKIKFASADEMSIFENTTRYNDVGNYVETANDSAWHTATVYFTSSFAYTVPKDENVNAAENKNADFGDMLYMYFEAEDGAVISIDNVALTEVSALYSGGASVLTEEASREAGSQALRFYFKYETDNIYTVKIGGEVMNLVERGIIFKNARNTATGIANGDRVSVEAITLSNKDKAGYTSISKTSKFNEYWDYDNKTESVIYSGYIKNFNLKDARLMGARGYIKVKDADGNVYTFYSADKKTTVKEGVETNSEITDVSVHTFAGVTFDKYTIVNPKLMPYIYGQQIEFLMEYAEKTHGVSIPRITEKGAETDYEIVIGDTTREASSLVSVENGNEYVIAVRGTKLIIKGGSDLATMQGVKDFIEYLKLKDSLNCGADLKDGYTKYGKVSTTSEDYKLAFNDDFNASQIDTSVWGAYNNQSKANNYTTESILDGIITAHTVNEGGFTTASGRVVDNAISVRNGNAVLACGRVNDTDFATSQMSTFWNMIYQYGMFEINCKLSAPPSHSGWWMNGAATSSSSFVKLFGREARGCMTEYDLIENFGIENYYASNIHYWWSATSTKDKGHTSLDGVAGAGNKNQTYVPDADETSMYDNYHIITFLWNNDNIVFALDGVKFFEFKNTSQYYDRMANYIILGQGIASKNYGVKYDSAIHDDYFETLIDYVRIYQIEDMGSRMIWANR